MGEPMRSHVTPSRKLPSAAAVLLSAGLLALGAAGCAPGAKDAGTSFASVNDSIFDAAFLTQHDVLNTVGGFTNFATPHRVAPATSFPSLPSRESLSLSQGCYEVLFPSEEWRSKMPQSVRSFIQTAGTTTGEEASWFVAEYGSADDITKIVQGDTDRLGKCDQVHRFEAGDGSLYAWSAVNLGSSRSSSAFVRIARGDVSEFFSTRAESEAEAQDQVKKLLPLMIKRLDSLPTGK